MQTPEEKTHLFLEGSFHFGSSQIVYCLELGSFLSLAIKVWIFVTVWSLLYQIFGDMEKPFWVFLFVFRVWTVSLRGWTVLILQFLWNLELDLRYMKSRISKPCRIWLEFGLYNDYTRLFEIVSAILLIYSFIWLWLWVCIAFVIGRNGLNWNCDGLKSTDRLKLR